MAIPTRVSSIDVNDVALYNDSDFKISWAAVDNAESYRLEIGGGNGFFTAIYNGGGTSVSLDISRYQYSRFVLRIYAINADGESPFLESKAVTVIDWDIEENEDGCMILQPIGFVINMLSSEIADVPSVRETSETIVGLDGEIPIDMKYSPRLFDLSCFMDKEFSSIAEREEFIRKFSLHINRSVRQLRYLKFRNKLFGVKRISSTWERRPTYCGLDISLKAYDIYGYSPTENIIYGGGECLNSGECECYPTFILKDEQNNPIITVNGKEYQLAIDALDGDTVTVDCEKEVVIRERNGVQSYVAGAYYLDFPCFDVGVNTVSGVYAVRWRDRFFTV